MTLWVWTLFLLGFPYALLVMSCDDSKPLPRFLRILSGVLIACVLCVTVLETKAFAADVYDMCKDPNYINTWWWYAWGCWMA